MPKGAKADIPDEPSDPANIQAQELSSNEQAVILPIFAGESKFACTWLCMPFAEYSKDSPDTSAKKG
jgi:hypothetical protein